MNLIAVYVDQLRLTVLAIAAMSLLETFGSPTRVSLHSRLRGLTFVAIATLAYPFALSAFEAAMARGHIRPLADLSGAPLWLGVAIAYATQDLGYYCFHRLQHAVPMLWRFHAVHHSIRELSAASSWHHWTEDFQRIVIVNLPVSLALGLSPAAGGIATVLLVFHGAYLHSTSGLHFGPLRNLLADNRFHRIHHSIEEKHFGYNYGAYSTVWDRVFRTAWWPKPDELPATGLADQREPEGVGAFVASGFRAG
jgi:sterol desaturase/sphingolipid hydroxylase (fatty acid hydroxylase superfamily)